MKSTTPLFSGRYYHTIGPKGRTSLPKAFRSHFDTEPGILTIGLDGSLFLFEENQWQQTIQNIINSPFTTKKHRDWIRLLTNNAASVSPDSLGRINIPDYLRQYASLNKQVVFTGSLDRIEIWDQGMYQEYNQEIISKADSIAESIARQDL